MQSEHSVLAAPYHRNQAGNIAMLDMFRRAARTTLEFKWSVTASIMWRSALALPSATNTPSSAPRSLAAALASNEPLRFLERLRLAGTDLDSFQRITADPASMSVIRYTALRPFVIHVNHTGAALTAGLLAKPPKADGVGR